MIIKYFAILNVVICLNAEIHTESACGEIELNGNKTVHQLQSLHKEPYTVTNRENKGKSCKLRVLNESGEYFSNELLKHKYNFVHLKLIFLNVNVSETKYVINKEDWVWTYKGEDGANQYLYLPGDFGYLSLGLLWTRTKIDPIYVYINTTGNCQSLTTGQLETDCLIGSALAEMMSRIPSQDDWCESTYWCYNQRLWLDSGLLYSLCKHAICTFQTFEYNCCKTRTDLMTQKTIIECGKDHYQFGELWWMFPIIIGHICFAFYPILLSKIAIKINQLSDKKSKSVKSTPLKAMGRYKPEVTNKFEVTMDENKLFLSVKHPSPVSFLSTVLSPLLRCYLNIPIARRLLRVSIILLPMVLSLVRVVLDYIYARDLVIEAVRKGALVGFSSLIAGPELAKLKFLRFFGGPYVALSIYVVFGCIVIVLPPDLEQSLEKGLPNYSGKYIFVVRMPLRLKERFSGWGIRNLGGWKRLHNILVSQIFLLLHWRFWQQSIRLFYIRWVNVIFPILEAKLMKAPAFVLAFLILPLYVVFCMIELVFSVLYFAFPVINCFWIVLKALFLEYSALFENTGIMLKMVRNIFIIPLFGLFCLSWYMFCIIFFDGFWFLSKVAMFTYSGIIAYPHISYGYLILGFMAFYYLMESFNAFGETYRQLLKMSIECCEKFRSRAITDSDYEGMEFENIMNKRGIRRDLFMRIVESCKPRRNQVMITLLKFTSVLTILTISVELLKTFDKFQDLSLVSHVFTVLFICALPKMIRVMCTHSYKQRNRKRLKQKIYRIVTNYVKSESMGRVHDQTTSLFQVSRTGYETFGETDTDDS